MTEDRLARVIEIVSALIIVAVVVALSVPKSGEVQRAREAQLVLADIETVRKAVFRFYSDSAYFPVQTGGRPAPDGLVPYLPRGFSFRRPYGTLDYRNWPIAIRDSTFTASNVVGVTVTVNDRRVGAAAAARVRDIAKFIVADRHTFLFFGS